MTNNKDDILGDLFNELDVNIIKPKKDKKEPTISFETLGVQTPDEKRSTNNIIDTYFSQSEINSTELLRELYFTDLPVNEKLLYMNMAKNYLDDFRENINKNSFDLADTYPNYTFDQWSKFLSTPKVNKYVSRFRFEMTALAVDKDLASGGSLNAIKAKQSLTALGGGTDNSRFVVFLLPLKEDMEQEKLGKVDTIHG